MRARIPILVMNRKEYEEETTAYKYSRLQFCNCEKSLIKTGQLRWSDKRDIENVIHDVIHAKSQQFAAPFHKILIG